MNLPTVKLETNVVHILGTSVDAMVKNSQGRFSTIPYSDRVTAKSGQASSYEVGLGDKTSHDERDGWRQADLRETVWLAIMWLAEEKTLPQKIVTSTEYHDFVNGTTQPNLQLLAFIYVDDGKLHLSKNYSGAIGDCPQSFWLRPASN